VALGKKTYLLIFIICYLLLLGARGGAVVEAQCFKPEGIEFDTR
jgi:hypothetical protein